MVSVQVFSRQTGRPLTGYRVSIGFDGFTRGMAGPEYTNSRGEVNFGADPGSGQVYVGGRSVFKGSVRGRIVVYV